MMRILIVEDEPIIARRIERLSREILGEELAAVVVESDLRDARRRMHASPFDVMFLDLNLRGESGFRLLKSAVAGSFHVIIVSAHTDQAVRAFEYGVLDFIGKPFNRDRLEKAYGRLSEARRSGDYATRYLAVRTSGQIDLVRIDDIRTIRAAGTYSRLQLRDGTTHLHDKSLGDLLTILPGTFERIHRSWVVPMTDVVRLIVNEGSRYEAELRDGTILPVGRTRYASIRNRLEG